MSDLQSLSQIFQNKIFRIPDYQRGYAWLNEQLLDFWDDMINIRPERYHYIGLLSLKVMNKQEIEKQSSDDRWLLDSGYKAYYIVDGQQRLTTFIILLNELINYTKNLEENKGKSEGEIFIAYESLRDIRAKYISRKNPKGIITTYLFGYENDNPSYLYLKHKILEQGYSAELEESYYTKNLKNAKEFFARAIDDFYGIYGFDGLEGIYKRLTLQMMFNIHEIEDDYDVYVAFETMNNRGKKLTNLELLKNRLIYLTTLYDEKDLDKASADKLRQDVNDAWREVYKQLGQNKKEPLSDDEFLRAHWIMYFNYSRKRGDDYIKFLLNKFSHKSIYENSFSFVPTIVYDTTQSTYADEDIAAETDDLEEPSDTVHLQPKEIQDYVNSLKTTARYWYYTFYPNECPADEKISAEEKLWLGKLNRIGLGYFRPMVAVSLIPDVGITGEKRIELYKAIERFIFINFRMAMYQSSYKSSEYYRITRELHRKEIDVSEIINDINITTDLNAPNAVKDFVTKMNRRFITEDGFYSWRDLKYFLYEYENSLEEKHQSKKLSWDTLTAVIKDKVSIEHILPQTPTDWYWRNQFRQFSAEEKRILASSLGNLLPLSLSINSSLQNFSFPEKKKRGYKTGCLSEIEISNHRKWNAKSIYDRGIKLLNFMAERWGFSFESKAQMEELLQIGFVNDNREIPEEFQKESLPDSIDYEDPADYRQVQYRYWAYALPKIREANDGPYSNVAPAAASYKDGFIGISSMHLYCSITLRPKACLAGLWIDNGNKEENKALFDKLYAHKDEAESKMSMKPVWDRGDDKRASKITVSIEEDYTDESNWSKISDFHAKYTRELYDYVFAPYKDEL